MIYEELSQEIIGGCESHGGTGNRAAPLAPKGRLFVVSSGVETSLDAILNGAT